MTRKKKPHEKRDATGVSKIMEFCFLSEERALHSPVLSIFLVSISMEFCVPSELPYISIFKCLFLWSSVFCLKSRESPSVVSFFGIHFFWKLFFFSGGQKSLTFFQKRALDLKQLVSIFCPKSHICH